MKCARVTDIAAFHSLFCLTRIDSPGGKGRVGIDIRETRAYGHSATKPMMSL